MLLCPRGNIYFQRNRVALYKGSHVWIYICRKVQVEAKHTQKFICIGSVFSRNVKYVYLSGNINILEQLGVMSIYFHCTPGVRIKCLQMTPFAFNHRVDPVWQDPVIYGELNIHCASFLWKYAVPDTISWTVANSKQSKVIASLLFWNYGVWNTISNTKNDCVCNS